MFQHIQAYYEWRSYRSFWGDDATHFARMARFYRGIVSEAAAEAFHASVRVHHFGAR